MNIKLNKLAKRNNFYMLVVVDSWHQPKKLAKLDKLHGSTSAAPQGSLANCLQSWHSHTLQTPFVLRLVYYK